MLKRKQDLTLVIDLDERDWFKGHVEDAKGKDVFEFSNEGENGWPSEDGFWLVEGGFMKHGTDTDGLLEYLVSVGVVAPGSTMEVSQ